MTLIQPQLEYYYESLLKNPKRLEEYWKVLDRLIVGEKYNKKVMFLNAVSCLNTSPNGTAVVGDASGGKTHLVRECLKLLPQHRIMALGGSSRKAFVHTTPTEIGPSGEHIIDFSGKILWFLESTGGEDSFEVLRPLLSRDQEEIRYQITEKSKSKQGEGHKNKIVIMKGCPAYIHTTTRIEALPEMGTRLWSITPDESQEQSLAVVKHKIMSKAFVPQPIDFVPLRLFIDNLKTYKVWIPYATLITLKSDKLHVRRDIDKIFSLIETICLFNQMERETIEIHNEKYLISTYSDYLEAIRICGPIIEQTLQNIPKKILDFERLLKDAVKSRELTELTGRKIAEKLKYTQSTVRNYCWQLIEVGRMTYHKQNGKNYYHLFSTGNEGGVTGVTEKRVTLPELSTALEVSVLAIMKGVTESIKKMKICEILVYAYSSVTLPEEVNSLELLAESVVNTVTLENGNGVTPGAPPFPVETEKLGTMSESASCKECGLASPPAVLNEDGICEMCGDGE